MFSGVHLFWACRISVYWFVCHWQHWLNFHLIGRSISYYALKKKSLLMALLGCFPLPLNKKLRSLLPTPKKKGIVLMVLWLTFCRKCFSLILQTGYQPSPRWTIPTLTALTSPSSSLKLLLSRSELSDGAMNFSCHSIWWFIDLKMLVWSD